ncbi:MAG TPA: YebC/PmpR family DNA-binding transcriptional regulator [Bacillota bacterium]|nr:YebC/PmpR family DNA-binding transcriptional regulator [Bacillota bacterium]
MAGHSKWSNIKRRKAAQDKKRGKIFARHSKSIYTAAKEGGGDPDMNPGLRLAIEKARDDNMPNDNIERAIQKATGTLDGAKFEEFIYEGYGPGGIAVIVEVVTDNRNRAAAEVRHAFSKNDGNLGESGSVSFMFDRKGYFAILNQDDIDEDELTLVAIDAGADDIETSEEVIEIFSAPQDFHQVNQTLIKAGYEIEEAELTYLPHNYIQIEADLERKMLDLIDMLEDEEDVQGIHHNLEISE